MVYECCYGLWFMNLNLKAYVVIYLKTDIKWKEKKKELKGSDIFYILFFLESRNTLIFKK